MSRPKNVANRGEKDQGPINATGPDAMNDDSVVPAPPPVPATSRAQPKAAASARQALRASMEQAAAAQDRTDLTAKGKDDAPLTLSDMERAATQLEERARARRQALREGGELTENTRQDETDSNTAHVTAEKVAALRGFLEAVQKDRSAKQEPKAADERRSGGDRRKDRNTDQAPPAADDKEQPPMADAAAATKDEDTPHIVAKNRGLEVQSLGKQFKKRPILRDVSLRVQRGEAVGLLGPNGAGKTTCFYMISGLIAADYGEILLDGEDITELPMYRRARLGIGYLPQEASIFRGLTVEQNIRAVLEAVEKRRDKREAMLDALMAEFSITHLRRSPAVALSGGERRRLEIARALASQPHFILLDEPLAGIDPIAVRDIRELVSHLKDRGIGVLITDHNVRETLDLVDRAYILHDGRVLMEGTPDEIVGNQEVRRVYLGDRFNL